MRAVHRATLAGTLTAWLLSGCGLGGYSDTYSGTLNPNALGGGTSSGGASGSPAPPAGFPPGASGNPTGSHDSVVATASVEGSFTVKAGASGTLTLSFASSDDRSITGFALSGNALPAGWSGLDGYSCTLLGAGRTCVLSLSYAPTAPESGTLTLDYVFIDNAGQPRAPGGSVQIAYAASSTDNVLATVAPAGFVAAAPGTQQSVAVAFNTDDGDAATGFYILDDLSALPVGWHSNSMSFACGIVSTGNGCVLPLSYAPSGAASGVLALHYAYSDHSGAFRTGVVDLPYGPGSGGHVVAVVAPGGQVNAVEMTGAQPVTMSFSSQDGRAASRFVLLSSLRSLPAGWSTGASGLSCASVGSGAGCSLALRYAPQARGRGVLSLEYAYLDAAGAYAVGLAQVPYASTTNDSVAAAALPAGPVVAIAAEDTVPVSVRFTTDDGRPATAVQVTSGLSMLPSGWSGPASFACAEASTGTGCTLALAYAPTAPDSGSVVLGYAYVNDAGLARTGTVTIPYRATADDSVVGSVSPNPVSVAAGASLPVTVSFTTDDGYPASGLSVTTDLGSLPAGWSSGTPGFTCASVDGGSGCQLGLSFAPAAPGSGTLSMAYTYTNDAGLARSGTVLVPWTATP